MEQKRLLSYCFHSKLRACTLKPCKDEGPGGYSVKYHTSFRPLLERILPEARYSGEVLALTMPWSNNGISPFLHIPLTQECHGAYSFLQNQGSDEKSIFLTPRFSLSLRDICWVDCSGHRSLTCH